MTAALVLSGLHVHRARRAIVRDVTTTISAGEWFGVIGANGSGKTTLLRAVAGRLPIAAGDCRLFGRTVAHDRSARARAIGFAPPIEYLPETLRIGEVLKLAGDPLAVQQNRNAALWQALGIGELVDRAVGECSSGMRQRAALALAFAAPTPIVILDEPFNWLDPVAAFDIRAVLRNLVEGGLALVTALHDLATLCGYCDRGIVLADGRVSLELDRSALREGRTDFARFEGRLVAALR